MEQEQQCRELLKKKRENLLELEEHIAEFIDTRAVPPDTKRARETLLNEISVLERRCGDAYRKISPHIPYLVNYKDQEREFRDMIARHLCRTDDKRERPVVCWLHGYESEATTNMLLLRLKRDLEKHCLPVYGQKTPADTSRPFKLYRFYCGGSKTTKKFQENLYRRIEECLVEFPTPAHNIKMIKTESLPEPVIFHTHIHIDELRSIGETEFLNGMLEFWGGWSNQFYLFLVCIFIEYPSGNAPIWQTIWNRPTQRAQALRKRLDNLMDSERPEIFTKVLPEFTPIVEGEVRQWAGQLERDEEMREVMSEDVHCCLLRGIKNLFVYAPQKSGGGLPMDYLAPKLRQLLSLCQ